MDGVLHNLWPTLAQCVDNYDAQWSKAWSELGKELEAERACTKEEHQAVRQWEKQA